MADDLQDFAATTMNELLGWYGYERLDSQGAFPKGEEPRSGSPAEGASENISGGASRRNRVCNWCRLARHTVSQVNLLDGEERLQFCSSRCLNQYKMHIFCRETQAYLQSNPLSEHGGEDSKLITPDLWLRDPAPITDARERRPGHKKLARKRMRSRPPETPPPFLSPPAAHSASTPPFGHAHQQLGANRTVLPPKDSVPPTRTNTVWLPYPLFVPLPVPIPIPIPLHKFLPEVTCEPSSTNESQTLNSSSSEDEQAAERSFP
ncbi:sine oculis-binding protein homolog B-like [Uloborus diversus]|uniref:sine oculis-binding protein homolog B-like n=1 Tax=Uloborus diversus TaxID=327109 RepID=UPI002409FC47|nr:sine oculis-binding protein homolog B-like [Uloborus diversus]